MNRLTREQQMIVRDALQTYYRLAQGQLEIIPLLLNKSIDQNILEHLKSKIYPDMPLNGYAIVNLSEDVKAAFILYEQSRFNNIDLTTNWPLISKVLSQYCCILFMEFEKIYPECNSHIILDLKRYLSDYNKITITESILNGGYNNEL